jgi:hypothetical protein
MLINPSPISAGSFDLDLPVYNLMMIVTLKREFLQNKEQVIGIWSGKCSECGVMYWTCDSFDWVRWLDDVETVSMILDAAEIGHRRYGKQMIVIEEPKRLHFISGKLDKQAFR